MGTGNAKTPGSLSGREFRAAESGRIPRPPAPDFLPRVGAPARFAAAGPLSATEGRPDLPLHLPPPLLGSSPDAGGAPGDSGISGPGVPSGAGEGALRRGTPRVCRALSRGRPSGSPGRPEEFGARSPDPRFDPGRRPAPAGAGRRFRFRSAGGRGSAAATERVATGSPEPSRDPGGWVGGRDPGDGFPDSGAGCPQAGGRRRASSASRQSSNRSSRMAARIRSVRRA